MLIKINDVVYNIHFEHCQIEITGRCNMKCQHCRAWEEAKVDLPFKDIMNVMDFFVSENGGFKEQRVTVSGGEPFLNKDLIKILKEIDKRGIKNIIITTNASLVTEEKIKELESLKLPNLSIQVSLDSPIASEHDAFRGYKGAFENAVKVLKRCGESSNLVSSMRVSVKPENIEQIKDMVELALKLNCDRIGIGSIIPVGRACSNQLTMNSIQKKKFIETITYFRKKYPQLDVTTEDPLKFALEDFDTWKTGINQNEMQEEYIVGGCTAGVSGFNVSSDGNITPCAVFSQNITNIIGKTISEIRDEYSNSELIKALLLRKHSGKCEKCKLNRICGGCRATAFGVLGDYNASDPTCWRVQK
ncbi:MAG TPA: radical SAM protein [Rickettsiales bacterium]|nr:radical SAM protein [Rickettsiales bacterium]